MSWRERIETAANIATICVAALLAVVLVRVYLAPARGGPAAAKSAPAVMPAAAGASLKDTLPGVDWSRNGRTLVLAISTSCHFCRDSEPFYRRIRQELAARVKMVAILPQPLSEAEQYLRAAGIQVDQIRQLSPVEVGVSGTPTLLLVDAKGTVTKIWRGKLQTEADEDQVIGFLKKG